MRRAVWYLRSHAAALGGDPDRIAAIGFSAGGMLAAHLGASEAYEPDSDVSGRVQRVVSIGGPWDLRAPLLSYRQSGFVMTPGANADYPDPSTIGMIMTLFGGTPESLRSGAHPSPAEAWDASPQKYISIDMVPTLMLHGSRDRLVPPIQAQSANDACNRTAPGRCRLQLFDAGHEVTPAYLDPLNRFLGDWLSSGRPAVHHP